tara:strand:+ start:376 stop:660 length:285 start_codon:yes stop_codon:yes gene_type:complete
MGLMEYIARQIFRGLFGLSLDLVKDVSGQGNNEKDKQAELDAANDNCVIDGCNAMTYQESEYCLRHQPSMVSKDETEKPDSNEEDEQKWWDHNS